VINYKPVLALSIILVGFLISISVAFLDMLGPSVPLPRKKISEILNTSDSSSFFSDKENTSAKSKRKSAELYLNKEKLVHGYSNLNFNINLSDPEKAFQAHQGKEQPLEIRLLNKRYQAVILDDIPFDPKNARLKS